MHPFVNSLLRSLYFLLSLVFCLFLIRVRNKKRSFAILRITSSIVVSVVACSLFRWGFLEIENVIEHNSVVSNLFNIAFFLICVTFAVISLIFCFEISIRKSVFLVSICCSIEHIARMSSAILFFIFPAIRQFKSIGGLYTYQLFDLLYAALVAFLLWFFVFRKQISKFDYDETLKDNRYMVVSFVTIFVCVVVASFNSFTIEGTANRFTTQVISSVYAILCCFLSLYLQINIMTSNKLANDKRTLDILIKRESQKNASFTENIETLQIEIHDLKKKIQRLEEMGGDSVDKIPIIEDFNSIIDKYNSFVKTGNAVIDGLLANKYLLAIKEEVDFTYFVDGTLLDFMDSDDLIALFDNLLSNAFEAAVNETQENRVIHLQVMNEKQMIMIVIRNYSSVEPKFEKGIPVTDKDKQYHGYGIKSVKRIVEKYNGEVRFTYSNSFFTCRIIFPNINDENK